MAPARTGRRGGTDWRSGSLRRSARRSMRPRMRYIVTCALLVLALALPGAAHAQEDVLEPVEQAVQVAPDLLVQAHSAALRGDSAEALARYLRVLAQQPDNVAALTGAGRAALDIGDVSAAAGFLARAEEK